MIFRKNTGIMFIIICMLFFIIITLPFTITHIPYCDESQNYMVSRFMNFENYKAALSNSGHCLLWYLILMPFSKFDIAYPYPMLIINYIILFSALLYMWFKSPFNNCMKFIITFSYMMTAYYAIVARCYTLGILGLFILAGLYKEQTKKPVLYALILGLTANTSVMAFISTSGLCLLFLFNLLKEIKIIDIKKTIFALLILSLLLYICIEPQIGNIMQHRDLHTDSWCFLNIKDFFYKTECNFNYIYLSAAYLFCLSFAIVSGFINRGSAGRQSVFYLVYTILFQSAVLYFIFCNTYHCFFYFINFIITIWIQNEAKQYDITNTKSMCFYIIFALILFLPRNIHCDGMEDIYRFGKKIQNNENYINMFSNSILFFPDNVLQLLFDLAPFMGKIVDSSVIYNGYWKYSYEFADHENFSCNEIKDFIPKLKKENKPVYMFLRQVYCNEHKDYNLVEQFGDIRIYRID